MKKLIAALVLCVPFVMVGCGDDGPLESISNSIDCNQICNKYSECVTDIDVSECTSHCQEKADGSEATEDRVQACEDCLDDTSCTEALGCWAECAFVPVSG